MKCPGHGQAWLEKEMSREGMTGKEITQAGVSGKGNEQGRKWHLKERNQVGMTGTRKFSVKSDWIKKWQEWLKEKEPGKHGSKKKCTRLESRKKIYPLVRSEKGNDPIRRNDPGGSDRKRNDTKSDRTKKWPSKRQDKEMAQAGETGKGNDEEACLRRGEKVKRKVSIVPV
jgi:hypothetical protein